MSKASWLGNGRAGLDTQAGQGPEDLCETTTIFAFKLSSVILKLSS